MASPMFSSPLNSAYGSPTNGNLQGLMAIMQMEMLQIMEMMLMLQMTQVASAGAPAGFANPNGNINDGLTRYLGLSSAGPSIPAPWAFNPGYNANATAPNACFVGNGNGSSAVSLGEQFLGQNSCDLRGQLVHFTAAGGQNKNCADFVSACLESTGQLQGHHVGVSDLEQSLIAQGYHRVSAENAKPGDVYITAQRSHTELVAAPGATRLIGSNNDRPDHQKISETSHDPSKGIYYSRA